MILRLATVIVALVLAGSVTALAVRPGEMLSNPQQEERARSIDKELRCLVCQNESIDDSNADLAHDLRVLVRQRVVAGDSNEQVKRYIVARYGNYVLLKPRFEPETYLLWFGPVLLLLGALAVVLAMYRRRSQIEPEPLSAQDVERVAALLAEKERG